MVVKSAIEQVHADDTERFLLFDVGFIKQPHVDDNLARWAAFLGLKSHAEPSVRFIVLFKTARCHGVRKNEKRFSPSEFSIESFHQKRVFVVEHRLKTDTTDIPIGRAVNRVAKCHVVGRHRFGDGASRAAHTKKSPCDLLARADLGKGSVLACLQINPESLFVGADFHLGVHTQLKM